jgi:hypothetical protein
MITLEVTEGTTVTDPGMTAVMPGNREMVMSPGKIGASTTAKGAIKDHRRLYEAQHRTLTSLRERAQNHPMRQRNPAEAHTIGRQPTQALLCPLSLCLPAPTQLTDPCTRQLPPSLARTHLQRAIPDHMRHRAQLLGDLTETPQALANQDRMGHRPQQLHQIRQVLHLWAPPHAFPTRPLLEFPEMAASSFL